jgi:hypothetical protein
LFRISVLFPTNTYIWLATAVQVTRKHLAGRIARVDISLDETQQIIEGTRDEVEVEPNLIALYHHLFIYLVFDAF